MIFKIFVRMMSQSAWLMRGDAELNMSSRAKILSTVDVTPMDVASLSLDFPPIDFPDNFSKETVPLDFDSIDLPSPSLLQFDEDPIPADARLVTEEPVIPEPPPASHFLPPIELNECGLKERGIVPTQVLDFPIQVQPYEPPSF